MHASALLRLPVACVALWCCTVAATPGTGDSWGVRLSGQTLETLSDVNVAKPARSQPVVAQPLVRGQRGDVSIELLADAATARLLPDAVNTLAPEIDKGLEWLQRLRPQQHRRVRLVLTLLAPQQHVKLQRVHGSHDETVVDLAVALTPTTSGSAAVGQALAVGLHEMSHVFSNAALSGRGISRRDDEYRASLVESCYLIDTMRVQDTLHLAPRPGSDANEYFVTAQSRDAAHDAVSALVRAAGTDNVRWDDNVALLGLKLACGIGLLPPQPGNKGR